MNLIWVLIKMCFSWLLPVEELRISRTFAVSLMNPMAVFAQGFRRSMYDNSFPGWDNLGACALVAVVSMVIGWSIFTKLSRRFAEEL